MGSTEFQERRGGERQMLMAACDLVCAQRSLSSPAAPQAAAAVLQRGAAHGPGMCVGWAQRAGQMSGAPLGIGEHWGVQRSQINLFCRGITWTHSWNVAVLLITTWILQVYPFVIKICCCIGFAWQSVSAWGFHAASPSFWHPGVSHNWAIAQSSVLVESWACFSNSLLAAVL